jgi:hypothetical protein
MKNKDTRKLLEKNIVIDNWFWCVFQTFFEKEWQAGNVLTMEKSWENKDGVLILPITKDKEIVYIDEFRFGPNQRLFSAITWWWFDNDNDYEKLAKKEILEETWYKAEKIIYLGAYVQNFYMNGKMRLFLWINCEKVNKQKLHDIEDIKVLKTSIKDFEKMIENNEIICPWTEIAFHRAKRLTNNFNF